jgi:hypothetical protein
MRGARVVLGIVVAATLLDLAPPSARAQEAAPAPLTGYQGSAAASGLHALYNPAGLLPVPPPVDLGAPDALATIASGPATFARASVLDPGDLLYSPDALLAQAAATYPAGTIPPYPFRISAASGSGAPVAESNPAPGLQARVEVGDGTSKATSSLPGIDAPGIATVGSMSALTTTETDGTSVTVHSRSEISSIDVLGLVKIGSVVTDLTATTTGDETELTGGTEVVRASILGQPVSIDADGIHATGGSPLLGGLLGPIVTALNDALGRAGITITVSDPVVLGGEQPNELASYGLRIGLELSPQTLPALAALIDALPPIDSPIPGLPSIEDVLALAQARHLAAIEVGRGSVKLIGRTGADELPIVDVPSPPSTGGIALPPATGSFDVPPTSGGTAPQAPGPVDLPTEPVSIPEGYGVGALVLLVLLAMPFVGERLSRICAAVLATDRSTTCTWEER